jgi:hypothetical protein
MPEHNRIDRLGGRRNRKHVGSIQRGIMRAFIAAGGRDLTTPELMEWTHAGALHRGASTWEQNYLSGDVRRAAKGCASRLGAVLVAADRFCGGSRHRPNSRCGYHVLAPALISLGFQARSPHCLQSWPHYRAEFSQRYDRVMRTS